MRPACGSDDLTTVVQHHHVALHDLTRKRRSCCPRTHYLDPQVSRWVIGLRTAGRSFSGVRDRRAGGEALRTAAQKARPCRMGAFETGGGGHGGVGVDSGRRTGDRSVRLGHRSCRAHGRAGPSGTPAWRRATDRCPRHAGLVGKAAVAAAEGVRPSARWRAGQAGAFRARSAFLDQDCAPVGAPVDDTGHLHGGHHRLCTGTGLCRSGSAHRSTLTQSTPESWFL